MEDGCSKRFDIGTLNIQGSNFGTLGLMNQYGPPDLGLRRPDP